MKLADMKMSPEEKMDSMCSEPQMPDYPYGLKLYLDEDQISKLGIDKMVDVGGFYNLQAVVKVTSSGSREDTDNDSPNGLDRNLELQIVQLGLEDASAPKNVAEKLYPKNAGA